ncbi:DUF3152 domain-containing protein [Streptomyces sp. NPDC049906]|uniref:DUF3152 domain-containing protein n=1 Tax=Streptomyces sp. NPDC049906 TaxID=3155656 RepID=UPI00343B1A01
MRRRVGRHSRKGPPAKPGRTTTPPAAPPTPEPPAGGTGAAGPRYAPRPEPRPMTPYPPYAGPHGTPAQGVPRHPDVRGGHPEQHEAGGGWGALPDPPGTAGHQHRVPGPRQEYLDAFAATPHDGRGGPGRGAPLLRAPYSSGPYAPAAGAPPAGAQARRAPGTSAPADPYASVTQWDPVDPAEVHGDHEGDPGEGPGGSGRGGSGGRGGPRGAVPPPRHPEDEPRRRPAGTPSRGGKGRTFTGIAAAAVTTVLAVVVAGQVTEQNGVRTDRTSTTGGTDRQDGDPPSRSDTRSVPADRPAAADPPVARKPTYGQQMGRTYELDPELAGSGAFEAVSGFAKAPGRGKLFRYRVDVEEGLGLDGGLFAEAVHKTLNDNRSWAHGGGRAFERVSSGTADFVITLASPGTTGAWCAKSGLDVTIDNVSCDSASTERVMINAYRWAQGSETYGDDRIHAYRQMLINHEVGHRLGFNHVSCQTDGALAPVMQQQTKFLEHEGIRCRANPWAFPEG